MKPSTRIEAIKSCLKRHDEYGHAIDIEWLIKRVEQLERAILDYKSECETSAPDALYKKACRDRMFEVLEGGT